MRARRRVTPAPLLVSLLALAALAVIVVAAIAVQRDQAGLPGISSANGGGGGGTVVRLNAIAAYDPEGDGGEHDSDAQYATDGNRSTYWRTDHYASQNFGGLKNGVGLVLRRTGAKLEKLTVTSDTPGFTAVVKAGAPPRRRGRTRAKRRSTARRRST